MDVQCVVCNKTLERKPRQKAVTAPSCCTHTNTPSCCTNTNLSVYIVHDPHRSAEKTRNFSEKGAQGPFYDVDGHSRHSRPNSPQKRPPNTQITLCGSAKLNTALENGTTSGSETTSTQKLCKIPQKGSKIDARICIRCRATNCAEYGKSVGNPTILYSSSQSKKPKKRLPDTIGCPLLNPVKLTLHQMLQRRCRQRNSSRLWEKDLNQYQDLRTLPRKSVTGDKEVER